MPIIGNGGHGLTVASHHPALNTTAPVGMERGPLAAPELKYVHVGAHAPQQAEALDDAAVGAATPARSSGRC